MCDNNTELLMRLDQKIDPRHCALVVIDVQNDFAASGGFFDKVGADLKPIQTERVPALLRLIAAARKAGVLVIFVQAIYDPECLSEPMRERNARLGMEMPRCLTGSWGADFFEVRPEAGEPVVIKHRYSAMTNPELRGILEQRKIRSLLLTGIATDTCVELLAATPISSTTMSRSWLIVAAPPVSKTMSARSGDSAGTTAKSWIPRRSPRSGTPAARLRGSRSSLQCRISDTPFSALIDHVPLSQRACSRAVRPVGGPQP